MRPRQLATVALLLLVAGCGPSAEERYQKAVQLYETEQKELDRVEEEIEAWIEASSSGEAIVWSLELARAKREGKPAAEIAHLQQLVDADMAVVNKEGAEFAALREAQAARVEKARIARDAADKARK